MISVELNEIKRALLNRIVVEHDGIPYYIVALSMCVPDAMCGRLSINSGDEYWQVTLHDLNANSVTRASPDAITSTNETLLARRRRLNKGGREHDS